MFFKRETPQTPGFEDQLAKARQAGFSVMSQDGRTIASRGAYAARLKEGAGAQPELLEAGVLLGDEIGQLTDVGYQKIFLTPHGKKAAATSDHLRGLHDFTEDLREALGITSLYNEGLGSTNELHLYDRVTLRDKGAQPKPWE